MWAYIDGIDYAGLVESRATTRAPCKLKRRRVCRGVAH